MNTFGNQFRLALFGESHGEALGILIDGLPAGIPLDEADFKNDLARRRSGAAGTTPRRDSTKAAPRERRWPFCSPTKIPARATTTVSRTTSVPRTPTGWPGRSSAA